MTSTPVEDGPGPEALGPSEGDWIQARVAAARARHPVTHEVADRITCLLQGEVGRRTITSTELSAVASALLDDMELGSNSRGPCA